MGEFARMSDEKVIDVKTVNTRSGDVVRQWTFLIAIGISNVAFGVGRIAAWCYCYVMLILSALSGVAALASLVVDCMIIGVVLFAAGIYMGYIPTTVVDGASDRICDLIFSRHR